MTFASSLKTVSAMSVALGLAMTTGAAQATVNGFANGGFETPGANPPAAQSWLPAASGYTLSTDARTGTYSAQLESPQFNAAIMLQNSIEQGGLPALVEGDTPELSFWAKGFAGTTANLVFQLRYLDDDGNILANSGEQFFQNSINPNTWTEITYDLGAVPTGATAAFIEFSQGLGPIDPDGGLFAGTVLIDDVYLGVVPEPASLALMGLGGLALVARRRRRA